MEASLGYLKSETEADISAFLPIGPAATLRLDPTVKFPFWLKASTASCVFNTMMKSVISPPIWAPNPIDAVAIADGADQEPSPSLAITTPVPALPDHRKPAFITYKMANPFAF